MIETSSRHLANITKVVICLRAIQSTRSCQSSLSSEHISTTFQSACHVSPRLPACLLSVWVSAGVSWPRTTYITNDDLPAQLPTTTSSSSSYWYLISLTTVFVCADSHRAAGLSTAGTVCTASRWTRRNSTILGFQLVVSIVTVPLTAARTDRLSDALSLQCKLQNVLYRYMFSYFARPASGSEVKIRSAVPENGCLIFFDGRKKQKKTKKQTKHL